MRENGFSLPSNRAPAARLRRLRSWTLGLWDESGRWKARVEATRQEFEVHVWTLNMGLTKAYESICHTGAVEFDL